MLVTPISARNWENRSNTGQLLMTVPPPSLEQWLFEWFAQRPRSKPVVSEGPDRRHETSALPASGTPSNAGSDSRRSSFPTQPPTRATTAPPTECSSALRAGRACCLSADPEPPIALASGWVRRALALPSMREVLASGILVMQIQWKLLPVKPPRTIPPPAASPPRRAPAPDVAAPPPRRIRRF